MKKVMITLKICCICLWGNAQINQVTTVNVASSLGTADIHVSMIEASPFISEFYDDGSDFGEKFEITNPTSSAINISTLSVELYNGSGSGVIYGGYITTMSLSNFVSTGSSIINPGAAVTYTVNNSALAGFTLSSVTSAIGLFNNVTNEVYDFVSYGNASIFYGEGNIFSPYVSNKMNISTTGDHFIITNTGYWSGGSGFPSDNTINSNINLFDFGGFWGAVYYMQTEGTISGLKYISTQGINASLPNYIHFNEHPNRWKWRNSGTIGSDNLSFNSNINGLSSLQMERALLMHFTCVEMIRLFNTEYDFTWERNMGMRILSGGCSGFSGNIRYGAADDVDAIAHEFGHQLEIRYLGNRHAEGDCTLSIQWTEGMADVTGIIMERHLFNGTSGLMACTNVSQGEYRAYLSDNYIRNTNPNSLTKYHRGALLGNFVWRLRNGYNTVYTDEEFNINNNCSMSNSELLDLDIQNLKINLFSMPAGGFHEAPKILFAGMKAATDAEYLTPCEIRELTLSEVGSLSSYGGTLAYTEYCKGQIRNTWASLNVGEKDYEIVVPGETFIEGTGSNPDCFPTYHQEHVINVDPDCAFTLEGVAYSANIQWLDPSGNPVDPNFCEWTVTNGQTHLICELPGISSDATYVLEASYNGPSGVETLEQEMFVDVDDDFECAEFSSSMATTLWSFAPVTLSATPPGGTFSGPTVIGNTFYPSLIPTYGNYTVIYTLPSANDCHGPCHSATHTFTLPKRLFTGGGPIIVGGGGPVIFNPKMNLISELPVGEEDNKYQFSLLDMSGRVLVKIQQTLDGNELKHYLQSNDLSAGIYLISITDGNGFHQTEKIAIQ